jgi:hypothetical protein
VCERHHRSTRWVRGVEGGFPLDATVKRDEFAAWEADINAA